MSTNLITPTPSSGLRGNSTLEEEEVASSSKTSGNFYNFYIVLHFNGKFTKLRELTSSE
jgi:hypothetical protein